MYLVSIYFDEKANGRIQKYIDQVARNSGNHYMLEGNVPPHITICAFEARSEERVAQQLQEVFSKIPKGTIQWASAGAFFPYVLYIAPVLNEYLHELSTSVSESLKQMEEVKISPFYKPFQWLPHTTIGKKLSKEEMQKGFGVLQESFGMFQGEVVKIGLAKTNPYRDIVSMDLCQP